MAGRKPENVKMKTASQQSETVAEAKSEATLDGPYGSACRCQSYNHPGQGGDQKEVALPAPTWSGKKTICVDVCIADAIQMLWENGMETLGCCCGHGKENPTVIIAEHMDGQRAKQLLAAEGRHWRVMQWRLIDVNTPNDQAEARLPVSAWQCDLGNGEWDHDWQEKHDSAGGEGGGPIIEWSWRECRVCGEIEEPPNAPGEPLPPERDSQRH